MKMMKKMAALVLAAFLAVPMAGSIVYAAEGSLQFTDPETQVGETVKVDMVIRSGGDAIGDADVTMTYDTDSLEFVSGDGVESDGSGKTDVFRKWRRNRVRTSYNNGIPCT